MVYKVTVEPADFEFTIDPNTSILQQGLAQDIDLSFGCQGGACGTCKVKKLRGKISYPDDELPAAIDEEEHAAGFILCCQAFAQSDLVLEIPAIGVNKQRILTLPVRLIDKQTISTDEVLLSLKLPGAQQVPTSDNPQNFEILAGAGINILTARQASEDHQIIVLKINSDTSNSFVNYLFNDIEAGELMRIRGPV